MSLASEILNNFKVNESIRMINPRQPEEPRDWRAYR